MVSNRASLVSIDQVPLSDGSVVTSREQQIPIDIHTSNRVSVARELLLLRSIADRVDQNVLKVATNDNPPLNALRLLNR